MLLLPTKLDVEHDETNQLNSRAIDFAYPITLNNKANCQSENNRNNDVENFGLLANNNGKTISINFKQTKMYCNATINEEHQCDNRLSTSKPTPSGHQKQHHSTGRFMMSTHKMHLIAVLLSYLLAFSIQTATARPNVDHNYDDSESNWQSVAIASENKVSRSSLFIFLSRSQN